MFDTALILAGGMGTRLKPLTNNCPKPLVKVGGKKFIEYNIELLKKFGITNIIILTGYKSEQFSDILRKYKNLRGIRVREIKTPESFSTVMRVKNAIVHARGEILICYGDVYSEANLREYYWLYKKSNLPSSSISAISRHKTKEGKRNDLTYKDIGFMAIKKERLEAVISKSSEEKIEKAIWNNEGHFVLKDDWVYGSLTDLRSMKSLEKQLIERITLFVDRDGVINRLSQKGEYVRNEDQLILDTDFLKIIEDKANQIERLIVLTNQPWVGEGTKNIKDHEKIKDSVIESLTEAGIKDVRYMACTHDFEKCCDCRKPKIGLIKKAVYETNFREVNQFLLEIP